MGFFCKVVKDLAGLSRFLGLVLAGLGERRAWLVLRSVRMRAAHELVQPEIWL